MNYLCNDINEAYDEKTQKEMLIEYKDFYGIGEEERIDNEFKNYLFNTLEFEAEEFVNNFKGENLIVVGSYGRWNGRFYVCKPIKNGKELVNFLGQWDFYKLYEENNKVKISCSDHDGNSYFELKQIRKTFQGNYGNIIDFIKPNMVEKYFKKITRKQMKDFFN